MSTSRTTAPRQLAPGRDGVAQDGPAGPSNAEGAVPSDPRGTAADAPGWGRPSPTARVAGGALALLSTQPITWAASLLTAALLPRYLGDAALGQYAAALAIASLISPVVGLGVPVYLLKRVATHRNVAALEVSGALLLLLSTASTAAFLLAVALPLIGLPGSAAGPLRIALAGMVVATVQGVLSQALAGQERFMRFAWLNGIGVAATAMAGIVALVLGGGLIGYMLIGVATAGLTCAVTWYASGFRFQRGAVDLRLWGRLAAAGLPFLGWEVARYVYGEIGKLLLVLLTREAVVGWYAAAQRITAIPVFIPVTLATPLYPVLSRHAAEPIVFRDVLRRSITLTLLLTVPISAMIAALAPAVPGFLGWPETFRNSVPPMMVLAALLPVVGVDMALGAALIALDRQRQWLYVAVVAAVFSPLANLLLIPLTERSLGNGAIGAAVCAVATELVMLIGAVVLMPRGILDRGVASTGVRVLIAGAGLAATATALRPVSLVLAAAAGATVYVVVAFALRALRPAEIVAVREMALARLRRTK